MSKPNKLVRDKIPEIIKADGETPITHIAKAKEYQEKLQEKLQEEVNEFLENPTKEELADILEVVYSLANLLDANKKDLEQIRKQKAQDRGGFKNKIILEEIKNNE